MNDTELDALLEPPALSQPATLADDLAVLIEQAHRGATSARRTPRIVAAATALTLVLGGATAAAANGAFDWSPWAQDSPSNRYVLPSGIECEFRIGAVTGSPEAIAAAEDIIETTDFVSMVDVDQVVEELKAQGATFDGLSADGVYNAGMADGANSVFLDLLAARGYSLDDGDITSAQMEGQCPGLAR